LWKLFGVCDTTLVICMSLAFDPFLFFSVEKINTVAQDVYLVTGGLLATSMS